MTERPTRATTAGQRYLDLRRLAQQTGRATDELLQLYALEGFLDRLSRSIHAERFVLKGGVLLAAFDARRPTKDIDFAAIALTNDLETIQAAVNDIAAIDIDDGLQLDTTKTTAEVIRDEDTYSGVRVTLHGVMASFVAQFHVDVNIGDPIWPPPGLVPLPRLLSSEPLRVVGYPIAMVIAEKLVTALQRGTANTRWRDFVDLARLTPTSKPDGPELIEAVRRVAAHRGVDLAPLSDVLDGFGSIGQQRWSAWRRNQRLNSTTPESFDELLMPLLAWADAAIDGAASDRG